MTTRVKREFNFVAGIWLEGEYQIGMYSFTLFIEILTDNPYEQSVALERMKYFIDEVVTNSIFIEASDKKAIDTFAGLGIKVGVLPLDPYDQALAIALLLKMNAITEDKMNITHITFKSQLSDDVEYLIDIEDEFEPYELVFAVNSKPSDEAIQYLLECIETLQSKFKVDIELKPQEFDFI